MNIIEKHDAQIVELYHRMHPELNPDDIMKHVKAFSEKHGIDIPCVKRNKRPLAM